MARHVFQPGDPAIGPCGECTVVSATDDGDSYVVQYECSRSKTAAAHLSPLPSIADIWGPRNPDAADDNLTAWIQRGWGDAEEQKRRTGDAPVEEVEIETHNLVYPIRMPDGCPIAVRRRF